MLTRLRVKGFKNLRDVDVRFGLFTCIAGANGVGKSNLFDAILFLSDLASMPIGKAADRARGTNRRISDYANLFFRGGTEVNTTLELIAEMIVPISVTDDYERTATPKATLLEYALTLRLVSSEAGSREPLIIEKESLRALKTKETNELRNAFASNLTPELAKKLIFGPGSRNSPFIEAIDVGTTEPKIKLWGDGDNARGRPPTIAAHKSPQTVLAGVNTVTYPTVLAARREMQSWRMLQLEPTALRGHDNYGDEATISSTGAHMAATLNRLQTNDTVAMSLSELLPDIKSVEVDDDKAREVYTLSVTMKNLSHYAASSLSDGTLRFLALSILSTDHKATGLICMEEPENGIHPLRIAEMLKLVRSLSDENPSGDMDIKSLRQVIINTHSPLVVGELPDDALLMAEPVRQRNTNHIIFRPLADTWRTQEGGTPVSEAVSKGRLLNYLRGDLWLYLDKQSTGMAEKTEKRKVKDLFWQGQLFP